MKKGGLFYIFFMKKGGLFYKNNRFSGVPLDSSYAYVMLSRCKSLSDLGILRPFPFHVLTTFPSNDLIEEEKRLEILACKTHNKFMKSKHK